MRVVKLPGFRWSAFSVRKRATLGLKASRRLGVENVQAVKFTAKKEPGQDVIPNPAHSQSVPSDREEKRRLTPEG